jgi:hypothetical protein
LLLIEHGHDVVTGYVHAIYPQAVAVRDQLSPAFAVATDLPAQFVCVSIVAKHFTNALSRECLCHLKMFAVRD